MPRSPSPRVRSDAWQRGGTLRHLAIECVTPELDGGRFPVKRVVGESLTVGADIFKDGHDLISARVRWRGPDDREWRITVMRYEYDSDRWQATISFDRVGRWTYTVEAWSDVFGTWRSGLEKKVAASVDVSVELLEGAVLADAAAGRMRFGSPRDAVRRTAAMLREVAAPMETRIAAALAPELAAAVHSWLAPRDLAAYDRELEVVVDRERARFAAWYEMFPRSQARQPGHHGTFTDAAVALERVAALGFDVVYLPPIHPIGISNRKGPNNALVAGPEHPGSPWAIGSADGGHTAVDPRLGTLEDFDRFVHRAGELGLEVALDYALQCSPDHPWLREHPEWFFIRPDGSIQHAENPPKKYQDIVPLNFWCDDREALWNACRDILLFWVHHGVRTFRVDNPHTKPFAFWEWVIAEVQRAHPDVIFLSEAFTRPKRMKHLAKLGFTQSYTYFTWRNTAAELREYLTELTQGAPRDYMRGNLFANTPDILHAYLQAGGRSAFRIRLLLASTLSPLYGIYSGFELLEREPLHAGSEEYLHSEKYEIRVRDWEAPGNIAADVARINAVRREYRALQLYGNLTFHASDNDAILFYRKAGSPSHEPPRHDRSPLNHDLLIAVNLDPERPQETMVHVPLAALGIAPDEPYTVTDLLTGVQYWWRGERNFVRLEPWTAVGHVLAVGGRAKT